MYIVLQVVYLASLYFILAKCSLNIVELNKNHNVDLASFAQSIYKMECKDDKTALIVYTDDDDTSEEFMKIISTIYHVAVLTVEVKNFSTYLTGEYLEHTPDITFIFMNGNSFDSMDSIIFAIETFPYWNIRGQFLVVASEFDLEESNWFNEVFESFWYRQALRVLLCFWNKELKIYAHNPFLEIFGYEVTNRTDRSEIFKYEIKNMYGYPIKTYNFDTVMKTSNILVEKNGKQVWVGPDGMVLTNFVETLNATLDVHLLSTDFSEKLVNEADYRLPITQFMKLFQEIYDFDIIFNGMKTYTDNPLDHIFLYERNDVLLVVPKSEHIPEYLYILLIIPLNVFIITIGFILVISIITFFIQKHSSHEADFIAIILDVFRHLLSESITIKKNLSMQEKLLMCLWLAYGVIFTTMFQSIFTSTLVAPKYYPEIDTLADLFKTNIKIYGGAYPTFHVAQKLTGENKKLLKHLIAVPTNVTVYAEDLDWIADYRHGNGFLIFTKQVYELQMRDKNAASGGYHIMKESPMPSAYSFTMRRDKLYYKELQKYLGIIQDNGLIQYWRNYNYGKNQTYMDNSVPESTDEKLLNFKHLKSAFILLVIGYVAGSFVLICEISYYKQVMILKRFEKNHIEFRN